MRGATHLALAGVWALALGSGCSAVHGLADAGPDDIDAADDGDGGSDPDASTVPGEVRVAVADPRGNPRRDVLILFHDPDGGLHSQATTDSNGEAIEELVSGSSLTMVLSRLDGGGNVRFDLNTVIGVKPGDVIELIDDTGDVASVPDLGDLELDFRTVFTGASSYEARVGCQPFTVTTIGVYTFPLFDDDCTGGLTPVDFIATARSVDDSPLAFSTHFNQALSDGTATPISAWRTDWERVTVGVTNTPAGVAAYEPELGIIRKGLDYGFEDPDGVPLAVGVSHASERLLPPGFAERLQPRVFLFYGTLTNPTGFAQIMRNTLPTANDFIVDVQADLPPRVSGVANPALDEVVFTMGSRAGLVAGAAGLGWADDTAKVTYDWFIMFPPNATSPLTLPGIPSDAARHPTTNEELWPPGDAAVQTQVVVGFMAASFIADYDQFRQQNGFELLDDPLPFGLPPGAEAKLTVGGSFGE